MNYAKLLEISSFFTWHIFLEVGKTQDMPSKIWHHVEDALMRLSPCLGVSIRCIILPLREQRRGIKSAGQDIEVAVIDVPRERLII